MLLWGNEANMDSTLVKKAVLPEERKITKKFTDPGLPINSKCEASLETTVTGTAH